MKIRSIALIFILVIGPGLMLGRRAVAQSKYQKELEALSSSEKTLLRIQEAPKVFSEEETGIQTLSTNSNSKKRNLTKSTYVSLDMEEGSEANLELFLRLNDTVIDFNNVTRAKVKFRLDASSLFDAKTYPASIELDIYELIDGEKRSISKVRPTVYNKRFARNLEFFADLGYFNNDHKDLYFDLHDHNNELINTYKYTVEARNIEAQVLEDANITLDNNVFTACDGEFGDCHLQRILEYINFEAVPKNKISTEVRKTSEGKYIVSIPIAKRRRNVKRGAHVKGKKTKVGNGGLISGTANGLSSRVDIGPTQLDKVTLEYDPEDETLAIKYLPDKELFTFTHDGRFGIGNPEPGAYLDIRASNGDIPSMILNPGTLTTTPVNGAIEFDGSNFYISKNGVRRVIAHTGRTDGLIDASNIAGMGGFVDLSSAQTVSNKTLDSTTFTGSLQIPGSSSNGYVLTSDANGNASWQATNVTGAVAINDLTDGASDLSSNVFLGNGSGLGYTGQSNTGLGIDALSNISNGNENTALGYQAGFNSNGSNNTLVGFKAGYNLSNGSNNIVIGSNLQTLSADADNYMNIGDTIFSTLDNSRVAIHNTALTPDASLEVGDGNADFIDGNGDLLVADDVEIDGNLYVNGTFSTTSLGGSYSNGSVIFSNATGALSEDNANFYYDHNNSKLGLGTVNPDGQLTVNGSFSLGSPTDTNESLTMLDIASTRGGANNAAIRAWYPAGGNLTNAEFGALTHRGGTWYSVYAKEGTLGVALRAIGDSYLTNGDVGIGTTTPGAVLEVNGFALIGDASSFNTLIGRNAGASTDGSNLIAIGDEAGQFSNGSSVVAIGFDTAENNNGSNLNAIGNNAGDLNRGDFVNAIGYYAAANNDGDHVNAFGYDAAQINNGTHVNALGRSAAHHNSANYVNAIGHTAAFNNTGIYSTAIGRDSLYNNKGNYSLAMGYQSLYANNGDYNTAIGFQAGEQHRNGSYNLMLGFNAELADPNLNNQLSIGNTIYGNTATGEINIGFATANPDATLEIGDGTASSIDGVDDLLVADDVEINGDLYVDGTFTTGSLGGAYSNGSVIFSNATGALSEDNANFYFDHNNLEMGLGTNAPSSALDIEVGIGENHTGLEIRQFDTTNNPAAVVIENDGTNHALVIQQDGLLANNDRALRVYSNTAQTTEGLADFWLDNAGSTRETLTIRNDGTGDILVLSDNGTEVVNVKDGGDVGIGTTTPGAILEVNGFALIGNADTFTIALGQDAGLNNNADYLNAIGHYAGAINNGSSVNALGFYTAYDNNGDSVNALGSSAARSNLGSAVNALGSNAGRNNTADNLNAFGRYAARDNNGQDLNAIGYHAGQYNNGDYVNAFGSSAARDNNGDNVNAIGSNAARYNEGIYVDTVGFYATRYNTADNVTALGFAAAEYNEGSFTNAIGFSAGRYNQGQSLNAFGTNAGSHNNGRFMNAIGQYAGQYNNGDHINAFGYQALMHNNGDLNTALGYQAGFNNRNGTHNTMIGYQADVADPNASFQLSLGNLIYGNFVTNGVTINHATSNPDASLEIGNGTASSIDGVDDLLVADDAEIDGDLFVEGSFSAGAINGSSLDGGFTNGSILFSNVNGEISEDNANFFFDNNNTRLGIGTDSPTSTLYVNGSSTMAGNLVLGYPGENINRSIQLHGTHPANKSTVIAMLGDDFRIYGGVANQNVQIGTPNASVYSSMRHTINANTGGGYTWYEQANKLMELTPAGLFGIEAGGAPSASLDVGGGTLTYIDGNMDVLVSDDLEVDGDAYIEGTLNAANINGSSLDGGFTNGSILFSNTSGQISEDNANFFYNPNTNRLGLGTNSPIAEIDLSNGAVGAYLDLSGADGDLSIRTKHGSADITIDPNNRLNLGTIGTDVIYIGRTDNPISTFIRSNGTAMTVRDQKVAMATNVYYPAAQLEVGNGTLTHVDGTNDILVADDVEINDDLWIHGALMFNAEYDEGNSGAASTVDFANGNRQTITLDNNTTLTLDAPGVGNYLIRLVQDATGSRTVTWAAASGSVKWSGGTAPTLSTPAGSEDIVTCYYNDTDYYCQASLDFN